MRSKSTVEHAAQLAGVVVDGIGARDAGHALVVKHVRRQPDEPLGLLRLDVERPLPRVVAACRPRVRCSCHAPSGSTSCSTSCVRPVAVDAALVDAEDAVRGAVGAGERAALVAVADPREAGVGAEDGGELPGEPVGVVDGQTVAGQLLERRDHRHGTQDEPPRRVTACWLTSRNSPDASRCAGCRGSCARPAA